MKWVLVKMIHSAIGRTKDQHATLKGLGLRKISQERWLQNSPEVRGMVNKIPHLVKIVSESDNRPS